MSALEAAFDALLEAAQRLYEYRDRSEDWEWAEAAIQAAETAKAISEE